ncbi:MAG: hypothetical protein HC780_07930 [Leptolyngbyaceae cyanobacterium CSU_1_3]|nr:hypothetical protein [Leptolyngbyaceae cyanobacterium CSU_1_3]
MDRKKLQSIRPYTAHLNAWIASNYQDDLQLLHGEALGHIQAWAKDKTLSIDDYRFLVASQKRDQEKLEQALAASETKNQDLLATQQRSQRQTYLLMIGLVIFSLIVGGVLGMAIATTL